jgi:hypothetical protein
VSEFKITCSIAKAYERQDGAVIRKFIGGLASGTQVDLEGERMADSAIQAFQRAIQTGTTLSDGQWSLIPLRSGHRHEWDDVLGWITGADVDAENNLWIEAELDQENPVSMGLFKKLTRTPELGKPLKLGLSVGGTVLRAGYEPDSMGTGVTKVYYDVDLREVSVVSQPAYPTSYLFALSKSVDWENLPTSVGMDKAQDSTTPTDSNVSKEQESMKEEEVVKTEENILTEEQPAEIAEVAKAEAEETAPAVEDTEKSEEVEAVAPEAEAEEDVTKAELANLGDRVNALGASVEKLAEQLTVIQEALTKSAEAEVVEEVAVEAQVDKSVSRDGGCSCEGQCDGTCAQANVIKSAVLAALEPVIARLDRLENEPIDKSYAVMKNKYDDLPFEQKAAREIDETDGREAIRKALELAFKGM